MSLIGLTLDPFQEEAVEWGLNIKHGAYYMEQGTGKTIVTLGLLDRILTGDTTRKALIVVPAANIQDPWLDSIAQFAPHLRQQVVVLSYERLDDNIKYLRSQEWIAVFADECQRLRGRDNLSSRRLKMLNYAEYTFGLTGTPLDDDPIELWAQFRFFAVDVFGDRWGDFKDEYTMGTGFMGKVVKFRVKTKMKKFKELTEPHIFRISKDVLGLPPPDIKKVMIDLSPKEASVYKQMLEESIYKCKKFRVTAQLAVTLVIKLQQITSGFIKDDDGEAYSLARRSSKQKALAKLLRKAGTQVIVFTKYKHEIALVTEVCQEVGLTYGVVKGKSKEVNSLIEDFKSGGFDVLVSNIKKGGVGLNIQTCWYMIYYSLGYSFIDFDQSLSRTHRRGQTHQVFVKILIARNTIDEYIYTVLKAKGRVAKNLMTHFERSRRQWLKVNPKQKPPRKKPRRKNPSSRRRQPIKRNSNSR